MALYSWLNDWNNIIRYVLFSDKTLKELMLIPEGTSILTFTDKYFIRAGYTSELLSNEAVRIVYGDVYAYETDVPRVTRNELSFDIYVKDQEEHNASSDLLLHRSQLIANRLIYLLTHNRYLYGYRFWPIGDTNMGTRVIGYNRYNVSFNYMRAY